MSNSLTQPSVQLKAVVRYWSVEVIHHMDSFLLYPLSQAGKWERFLSFHRLAGKCGMHCEWRWRLLMTFSIRWQTFQNFCLLSEETEMHCVKILFKCVSLWLEDSSLCLFLCCHQEAESSFCVCHSIVFQLLLLGTICFMSAYNILTSCSPPLPAGRKRCLRTFCGRLTQKWLDYIEVKHPQILSWF